MVRPLTTAPLGNTGMQVAPLSLGTVKFGRDRAVKYPNPVTIPDRHAAAALLDQARALGINLLDTAPAYGNSEQRLGELLKTQPDHWLICTKVGEEFDGTGSSHDFSPEHCTFSVNRSLQRLGREILDIVLIHSNGDDLDILKRQGTLECLQELKAAGKIRAAGISPKSAAGAELALQRGADVLMATLNRQQREDAPVIAAAAARGCGILIKKALSSGHGSAADLAWVAAQPGVHSIVVGTTNPDHLRENADRVQNR